MKKIILCFIASMLAVSCLKFENKESETTTAPSKTSTEKQCYLYTTGRDSIKLSVAMNANNANGELAFNFYQKDKSSGTLSGMFIGDTLFADYTFRSEGMKSVREMVFLRREGKLIVASGDMEERGGKQVFTDDAEMSFDDGIVLEKTGCN